MRRWVDRGSPRLNLTNMLEPRIGGLGADADRVSALGGGILARCEVAGKQLKPRPHTAIN